MPGFVYGCANRVHAQSIQHAVPPSSPCSIESNRHHFYLDYEELTVLDVWEGTVGGDSELVSVGMAVGASAG